VAVAGSARTWYGYDALGSVRRTVADSGTPLGIVTYDPWGTPESGTVPTFGFTGEVQDTSAGLVNLRARWYSTAQGRFTTQDTWAGEPIRPGSFNQYNYTESNPVNRTDPTGHDWTYDWALVRRLSKEIKAAAQFHDRGDPGFPWQVIAALMGADIAREQRLDRKAVDRVEELNFQRGGSHGADDSTGLANIRPSGAAEILYGIIPDVSGKRVELDQRIAPGVCVYRLTAASQALLALRLKQDNPAGILSTSEARSLRDDIKYNDLFSLDLLGANISRGIDRAKAFSLTPSIFNVGNWLWNGVQEPWRFWNAIADGATITSTDGKAPGFAEGLAMVEDIKRAADELGLNPLPPYVDYYRSSDPQKDEQVLVECAVQPYNNQEPLSIDLGYRYIQAPACGGPLTEVEFLQKYGNRLRR